MASTCLVSLLLASIISSIPVVTGKGFLRQDGKAAAANFGEELQEALGEVMGCGGQIDSDHLEGIGRALQPMWHTLPKNARQGRLAFTSLHDTPLLHAAVKSHDPRL